MTTSTIIDLVEVVAIGFLVLGVIAFVLWFFTRLDDEKRE